MNYSIIIPAYNEENTIKDLIVQVKNVNYPGTRQIIVIDDGSTDKTSQILKSTKGIFIIQNKRNYGKGYSLKKGFKKAEGDIIIIQDADLEYDPNDHLKLIKILEESSADIVYGSRFLTKKHRPRYTLYYFGNIFLSLLTKILYFKNITDMETCYKAFRSKVLNQIELTENRFGFEPEITCKVIKKGYKIAEVPVRYKSRSYSEGKKIGIKDGLRALYILIKYRFIN